MSSDMTIHFLDRTPLSSFSLLYNVFGDIVGHGQP